jgi:DSF synthase
MLTKTRGRPQLRAVPGVGRAAVRPPRLLNTGSLRAEYDAEQRAVWMYMCPEGRPCFSAHLLGDILAQQHAVAEEPEGVDFVVLASAVPNVFNLGGDLDLFRTLALAKDEAGLVRYAEHCARAVHSAARGLDAGIVTVAVVQGDALGGGLEAALACSIVVAERGAKMGFPEILFNLFPGMGAYSLVTRKVGPRIAEDLITSGRVLSAEEMHQIGLVDYLAEKGMGERVTRNVISDKAWTLNGYRSFQMAKLHSYLAVPYRELLEIAREWARAACRLDARDLKMMERLVRAQERLTGRPA